MSRPRPRLAVRLMTAMALVIVVGGLTLLVTVNLVAPGLFHDHLSHFGMMAPDVTAHAEQAFASSFAIAITVAMAASLLAAGLVSWFLVRRVARPVEELATAAETVAAGTYTVNVPTEPFSSELEALSTSFSHMADRLAETETSRTRLLVTSPTSFGRRWPPLRPTSTGSRTASSRRRRSPTRRCAARSPGCAAWPPTCASPRPPTNTP